MGSNKTPDVSDGLPIKVRKPRQAYLVGAAPVLGDNWTRLRGETRNRTEQIQGGKLLSPALLREPRIRLHLENLHRMPLGMA